MIASGTYELGPSAGALRVRTGRAGAAARVGHDLVLEAGRWQAQLVVDGDDPSRSTLTATVDPASLQVIDGTGGVKPLGDGDRKEIVQTIAKKILTVDKHPEIRFTSKGAATADGTLTITGNLALAGRSQPVALAIAQRDDGAGAVLGTEIVIEQTAFGIKPFSTMMGALKVADKITIEVSARV